MGFNSAFKGLIVAVIGYGSLLFLSKLLITQTVKAKKKKNPLHLKQIQISKIKFFKFKICKPMHHHTIQINQPTRCKNFSSLLLEVYVQLNMFRVVFAPIIRSSTTAVAASGFIVGAW